MLSRNIRNRIKIPNRVAALAALSIVLGSIAHPEQLQMPDNQESLVQQNRNSSVDEAVTELAGVAVTAAKPVNLDISSLIFRF